MIFIVIENFIFFSTIFAVVGFLIALIVRNLNNRLFSLTPFSELRFYTLAIVVPPLLALWLVVGALLPQLWVANDLFLEAHAGSVHEIHLFGDLTMEFEPFLAVATVLLILTIIAAAVLRAINAYLRLNQLLGSLEMPSDSPQTAHMELLKEVSHEHDLKVALIWSDRPFTFVWGLWRTKLIISSGLLSALSLEELEGVLAHEVAHHNRKDNFFNSLFSAIGYLSLVFPLTQILLGWRKEMIEFVCDGIASRKTTAPLEVASALVKLSRISRSMELPFSANAFFLKRERSVEKRIMCLMELDDKPGILGTTYSTVERPPKFELAAIFLMFGATLIALFALAPLAVHRVAESLFFLFTY